MDASTVLEIVRIGASSFGAVLSFVLIFSSRREQRFEQDFIPTTRDEVITKTDRLLTRHSAGWRAVISLAMQLGMLYVAWDAFQTPTVGEIGGLALKSNLNQITNIVLSTLIILLDLKDIGTRHYIREIAEYVPVKRSRRSFRTREDEDSGVSI